MAKHKYGSRKKAKKKTAKKGKHRSAASRRGYRAFLKAAAKHGGVKKYKKVLAARLARARGKGKRKGKRK